MFITKTKTKDTTIYYLSKSFRDRSTGKVTTKIIEKIGSEKEIKKKIGKNKSVEKGLKEYAIQKTKEEKESIDSVTISLSPSTKLEKSNKRIYNAGYLIVQKICYALGLDKICKDIEKTEKFKGDLFQILTYTIYTNNSYYGKNINVLEYSQKFIERPKFNGRQFYLALKLLAKYAYKIQYNLFDNINKYTNADNSIIYYDTNDFYHDFINPDEDFENLNENDKIVKYEVGYNSKNVPLAYSTYRKEGDYDESEYKLGEKILKRCKDSLYLVLSSFENPYTSLIVTNQRKGTIPIRGVKIQNLKKEYQEWATSDEDGTEINSQATFTMDEIKKKLKDPNIEKNNNEGLKTARFYKTKKVKGTDEKTKETTDKILVSIFSNDLKEERIQFNKNKVENINRTINTQLFKHRDDMEFCKTYLKKYDKYIDINTKKLTPNKSDLFFCYTFKKNVTAKLSEFSGFYTFLIDCQIKDLQGAIRAQTSKWVNDYSFTTVAKDLNILPKYIHYQDRVEAHLLTTYLSLLVWRIIQGKSKYKFTDKQINTQLHDFNFIYVNGKGGVPCYEINNITNFFQKVLGQQINRAFLTTRQMENIIKSIKC